MSSRLLAVLLGPIDAFVPVQTVLPGEALGR